MHPPLPLALRAATLAVLCVVAAEPAGAQGASPYVPLGHWTLPFLEHFIATGVLSDPTPLTRPLRLGAVLRSLEAADSGRADGVVHRTLTRLRAAWQPLQPQARYRVETSIGASTANYAVRDPLELDRGLPPRTKGAARGFGDVELEAQLRFGHVIGVTHPVVDTRLEFDPDWYGRSDNSTRFSEAYLSGQWGANELFFGMLDRNWGPSGIGGVLLSSNPYSMDHFALTVGTERVQLQTVATELNPIDSAGLPINRYMVQNRLWLHLQGRYTIALENAAVTSGVARELEPWYLNPASLSYFRASYGGNANHFWGVDLERRGAITLFGQFMLDDIQVSRNAPQDLKPVSYAWTVGAKGGAAAERLSWTLYYTQVANLTYRNEDNYQVPLYYGLGTGRNFADYDQATARVHLLAAPLLLVGAEATLLRQGTGDPRLPHPLVPQYPTTPVLLDGVVQRTLRLAIDGAWLVHGSHLSLTGDAGIHVISNAGHVTGASRTDFLGRIGLSYRIHTEGLIP